MPGRLQDKVAIITGSSSGIGRAIALLYAQEGATIICADIHEEARAESPCPPALTTIQELTQTGAKTLFVKCDTSRAADVQALIATTVDTFGRLDIMVNNAGVAPEAHDPKPIWDASEEHWATTLAVNLTGVFLGTKYAAAQMRTQDPHASGDRGWIVNVSSVHGLGGQRKIPGYVASKHGVLGVTKTAAWDCAPERIHVNAVCPGYTQTAMTRPVCEQAETRAVLESMHPFRGLGTPEDIARAAVFLASEDASWITGVGLPVDGGFSSM